jgi:hypothetical protein
LPNSYYYVSLFWLFLGIHVINCTAFSCSSYPYYIVFISHFSTLIVINSICFLFSHLPFEHLDSRNVYGRLKHVVVHEVVFIILMYIILPRCTQTISCSRLNRLFHCRKDPNSRLIKSYYYCMIVELYPQKASRIISLIQLHRID